MAGCTTEGALADEPVQASPAIHALLVAPAGEWVDTCSAALRENGLHVAIRNSYAQGIAYFMRRNPDLVLASWTLEDCGGPGLLRRVRTASDKPFLVLADAYATTTPQTEPAAQRLLAFQEGADDVVPFDATPDELVARVHAALRRSRYQQTGSGKNLAMAEAEGFLIGASTAQWHGADLNLTGTEKDLLRVLLEYRGELLSKPYLQLLILKRPFVHHDRSIDVHISNLRRKLDAAGHPGERIRAVRGYGYRYD